MTGLIAAALGLALALAGDVAASRLGAARVSAYATSLIVGFCATLAFALCLPSRSGAATIAVALLAYGAWWFSFLNLVQALESSLRVKLLGAVRAAGGRISRAGLAEHYNDGGLLRLRLDRLRASGTVRENDGRLLVVSPGLRAIAGFFRLLKKVLIGRTSEFGAPSA